MVIDWGNGVFPEGTSRADWKLTAPEGTAMLKDPNYIFYVDTDTGELRHFTSFVQEGPHPSATRHDVPFDLHRNGEVVARYRP